MRNQKMVGGGEDKEASEGGKKKKEGYQPKRKLTMDQESVQSATCAQPLISLMRCVHVACVGAADAYGCVTATATNTGMHVRMCCMYQSALR